MLTISLFTDSDADTAFADSDEDFNLDDLEMDDQVPMMGRIYFTNSGVTVRCS